MKTSLKNPPFYVSSTFGYIPSSKLHKATSHPQVYICSTRLNLIHEGHIIQILSLFTNCRGDWMHFLVERLGGGGGEGQDRKRLQRSCYGEKGARAVTRFHWGPRGAKGRLARPWLTCTQKPSVQCTVLYEHDMKKWTAAIAEMSGKAPEIPAKLPEKHH